MFIELYNSIYKKLLLYTTGYNYVWLSLGHLVHVLFSVYNSLDGSRYLVIIWSDAWLSW